MALVKVKQFFMSNENIAEEKRGSMYALPRKSAAVCTPYI